MTTPDDTAIAAAQDHFRDSNKMIDVGDTAMSDCAGGAGASTEAVEAPTVEASHVHAWELDEDDTDEHDDDDTGVVPGRETWRETWVLAGALAAGCALLAALFIAGFTPKPPPPPLSPTSQAPTATPTPTTPATPAAAPAPSPPVTVTPDAPTATVTAEPPAAPYRGGSGGDVFTVCPGGHEGVLGGHTSCAFAAKVRYIFDLTDGGRRFTAYSPVTGGVYDMTCVGGWPASFGDGSVRVATRCVGGNDAVVVLW